MVLYIRALGFSEFDAKDKAEDLVASIIEDPSAKYVWKTSEGEIFVEYYQEYGKGFGLVVRGTIDEDEEINVHSLVPSTRSAFIVETDEVDVLNREDKDIYHAFCEELDSGTPIAFYLQNLKEYNEVEKDEHVYVNGVRLSAYCVEGTVVLPIDKDQMDLLLEEEEEKLRKDLLDLARKGDEDAMNILDEEAEDASEALRERLKKEDILSVLEGYFVPVGDQDDIYSVLANIDTVELLTNRKTNEEIFHMVVTCMSIKLEVYVAKKDLIGQPTPGMRFKGTCWLHGEIDFHYDADDGLLDEDA